MISLNAPNLSDKEFLLLKTLKGVGCQENI